MVRPERQVRPVDSITPSKFTAKAFKETPAQGRGGLQAGLPLHYRFVLIRIMLSMSHVSLTAVLCVVPPIPDTVEPATLK